MQKKTLKKQKSYTKAWTQNNRQPPSLSRGARAIYLDQGEMRKPKSALWSHEKGGLLKPWVWGSAKEKSWGLWGGSGDPVSGHFGRGVIRGRPGYRPGDSKSIPYHYKKISNNLLAICTMYVFWPYSMLLWFSVCLCLEIWDLLKWYISIESYSWDPSDHFGGSMS